MVNGEWSIMRERSTVNFRKLSLSFAKLCVSFARSLRLNGAALSSNSMLLLLRPQFKRKERKGDAKFRKGVIAYGKVDD